MPSTYTIHLTQEDAEGLLALATNLRNGPPTELPAAQQTALASILNQLIPAEERLPRKPRVGDVVRHQETRMEYRVVEDLTSGAQYKLIYADLGPEDEDLISATKLVTPSEMSQDYTRELFAPGVLLR